ncbi:hypothetical protein [Hymenobacter rubidus]|uniref:hypothetical protein n=1 Tax=Hymenobacter rubidus TaxID=1441626 RepID=UPI00191FC5D2|nr:hypothetical protein [Hymenobacter rubidus]
MESLAPTNPNYTGSTETVLDRIRASYLNEGAEARLSAADIARRTELEAAHGLLTNYHSLEQAVPLLMGRYELSRATAYRRCNEAIRLFGDVTRAYKDGVRHILYEMSMKVFQLAAGRKDEYKNAAPDLKAMNAAIKNMAVLKGLDKEDTNALSPEVLANKTYVVNITIQGKDGQPQTVALNSLDKIEPETYAQLIDAVENSDLSLEQMRGLLDKTESEEEDGDEPR